MQNRAVKADDSRAVPDLVGLGWREARALGFELGFHVSAPNPDGPPLAALGWPDGLVVRQEPLAEGPASHGDVIAVWISRAGPDGAGDREPREPRIPVNELRQTPPDNR